LGIPWLYDIPLWVVAILFAIVLFLALESGFRIGLRQRRATGSPEKKVRGDVTLSSMLALLGLMLAFTYAFTLSRADARKSAVVDEANVIGTAFFKAGFLSEPGRSELRARLLDYARTRVITSKTTRDQKARKALIDRALEAQSQIWPALERALEGKTLGPYETSMVQAINEVLDAQTRRITVAFDRIPPSVSILLLAIAAFSLAVAGSNAGLTGRFNRWRMSGFVIILTALMLLILDFDQPQTGFIRLNNSPIIALIDEMEKASQN
jgi:hypothetical protein